MSIEQRLSRLERSNRQLKLLCVALCLALAGVFVIAADKPGDGVQDVVRARKFMLIDGEGNPQGGMAAGKDGAALILQRADHKPVVGIIAKAEGGEVQLFGNAKNDDGGMIFDAGPDDDKGGMVDVFDAKGKKGKWVLIGTGPDTCGVNAIDGDNGAFLTVNGFGAQMLLAKDKRSDVYLKSTSSGGDLKMADPKGATAILRFIDGVPRLLMANEQGNARKSP